jgi:hypothetical protein
MALAYLDPVRAVTGFQVLVFVFLIFPFDSTILVFMLNRLSENLKLAKQKKYRLIVEWELADCSGTSREIGWSITGPTVFASRVQIGGPTMTSSPPIGK